jgi:hypothetical protein
MTARFQSAVRTRFTDGYPAHRLKCLAITQDPTDFMSEHESPGPTYRRLSSLPLSSVSVPPSPPAPTDEDEEIKALRARFQRVQAEAAMERAR